MAGLGFNWRDGSLDYNLGSKAPCYSIVTFRLADPLPAAFFLFGTKSQGGGGKFEMYYRTFSLYSTLEGKVL
jgi:hypothetical protein